METKRWDYTFKVLLIGAPKTGKSCIISRFAEDKFDDYHVVTIGIDFKVKSIEQDGSIIKIFAWNSAGIERLNGTVKLIYK